MNRRPDYLLDTGIVLHYARASAACSRVEQECGLAVSTFRPMVCVVTLGEIRAIALRRGWDGAKLNGLDAFLANLVSVDISPPAIINAYAAISAHATRHGWALAHQKNDLWIAAAAQVTGATLLTMDKDFTPAQGVFINRMLFDSATGEPIG